MAMQRKRLLAASAALLLSMAGHAFGESAAPGALPLRLSETGLFEKGAGGAVAPGTLLFAPQYPLWTDGATKRRWIQLPPGSFIDAANPDAWEFPRGTRLWKEFSLGRKIETRFIERLADGSWRFASYVWNDEGTDAVLAPPEGLPATTTRYAIPSETDCRACHEGAAAPVLGFGALQLSSDRDPLAPHAEPLPKDALDLRGLIVRGWVRNLPKALVDTPPRIEAETPTERAALGYLHGNCGHCHARPSDTGASVPVGALLAQEAGGGGSAVMDVLRSLIGAPSRFRVSANQSEMQIVAPGAAHMSVLPVRMRSRDSRIQMPPLGTAKPDQEAIALIEKWINEDLKNQREILP